MYFLNFGLKGLDAVGFPNLSNYMFATRWPSLKSVTSRLIRGSLFGRRATSEVNPALTSNVKIRCYKFEVRSHKTILITLGQSSEHLLPSQESRIPESLVTGILWPVYEGNQRVTHRMVNWSIAKLPIWAVNSENGLKRSKIHVV